jgi:hypothetical protein
MSINVNSIDVPTKQRIDEMIASSLTFVESPEIANPEPGMCCRDPKTGDMLVYYGGSWVPLAIPLDIDIESLKENNEMALWLCEEAERQRKEAERQRFELL